MYFAYGSNLNLEQMSTRCHGAVPILRHAQLIDWSLKFFGCASIVPSRGNHVEGGLWLLNQKHVEALDRYEGYPSLYHRADVYVNLGQGLIVPAMTYLMPLRANRAEHAPSAHYRDVVLRGYQDFGIGEKFQEGLVEHANRLIDASSKGFDYSDWLRTPAGSRIIESSRVVPSPVAEPAKPRKLVKLSDVVIYLPFADPFNDAAIVGPLRDAVIQDFRVTGKTREQWGYFADCASGRRWIRLSVDSCRMIVERADQTKPARSKAVKLPK